MIPGSPEYKRHHLWTEAIALAHQTYALADTLAPGDAAEARRLRRLAVTVPARLAGALSSPDSPERAADVAEARAALQELASSASRLPALPEGLSDLPRRARILEGSVAMELGLSEDGFVC
ncbi:MAG: hypothetical protein ABI968_04330 [Acidobacteriota bacterium]